MPEPKDNRIDPRLFVAQSMTLRATRQGVADDYAVVIAGHVAARITRVARAGSETAWNWSITGPSLPRSLYPHGGMASSLDEAKAEVRRRFDAWLAWALGQAQLAIWHGAHSGAASDQDT